MRWTHLKPAVWAELAFLGDTFPVAVWLHHDVVVANLRGERREGVNFVSEWGLGGGKGREGAESRVYYLIPRTGFSCIVKLLRYRVWNAYCVLLCLHISMRMDCVLIFASFKKICICNYRN